MALDDALFLIQRDGIDYKSSGSVVSSKIQSGDRILVQRNGGKFSAVYNGNWNTIQDSDLVLAWDGTNNRKVTGANFKSLFIPPLNLISKPVIQRTDITNSYGSRKYERVVHAVVDQPYDWIIGYWWYTRDYGANWYSRTDDYGYFYFEANVTQVKYSDKLKYNGVTYEFFSSTLTFQP